MGSHERDSEERAEHERSREAASEEQQREERPSRLFDAKVGRRDLLRMAGMGGLGLLLGAGGVGTAMAARGTAIGSSAANAIAQSTIPFYGAHQAGIVTPSQNFLVFASFDLTTEGKSDIVAMMKRWTVASAKMCAGAPVGAESGNSLLPPTDTGEAQGLSPSHLTLTFGAGPSLFDARYGLASKRPAELADFPAFAGEELRSEWCGGDLCVQACADDLQVAFHAIRNLARIARGTAVLRWTQEGFQRTGQADPANSTPRNIMGFRDGTGNPDVTDKKSMDDIVWVPSSGGTSWMKGGSFMAVRRIRMRLEVWDRSTLKDQEATFGRHRDSGAPLGESKEFEPIDLSKTDSAGKPLIPAGAHVRLAHGQQKILRRSYSYSAGIDLVTGQLDAGLFFICYQQDLRRQFIPIQQKLASQDSLNEYIVHMGSAAFACFPGVREGGYVGETLLEG